MWNVRRGTTRRRTDKGEAQAENILEDDGQKKKMKKKKKKK
jgi:hypothetical protein